MSNALAIVATREISGKSFTIYGDAERPLFLAKDVAKWIEHSDVSMMLRAIDEDEKLVQTMFVSGQNRECAFLTENGLYEVLMLSRKPVAKQFKREVKRILHEIRTTGRYTIQPEPPALFRHEYRGARVATTAELAEYWSVPPMRLHTALSKNSARFTDGVDIFRASSLFGDKSALTQTRNGQFQYSNLYTPSGAAKMAQLIGKHLAGLPALPASMVKRGAFVPVVRLPDALDQRGAEYDDFVTASLFEVIAGMDARTRRAWFDQLRERGQIEPATVNKPELIERLHRSRSHAKGIFSRVIGAVARCLDISGIDPGRIRLRGDFARLNFQRAAVAGNMIGEE